jgi:hypothetical protein
MRSRRQKDCMSTRREAGMRSHQLARRLDLKISIRLEAGMRSHQPARRLHLNISMRREAGHAESLADNYTLTYLRAGGRPTCRIIDRKITPRDIYSPSGRHAESPTERLISTR